MGFKLKSQKNIKQGGFKLMGSSPMKEDDVESKIKSVEESDYFLDDKGNPIQVSIPEVQIKVNKDSSPIADAINKSTKVERNPITVNTTTKTRTIGGIKDVEKKTYKTPRGAEVREKTKFDRSGKVTKTKTKTKRGSVITKTKTKGDKTKTKVRKAGSVLNEATKKQLNI